MKKLIIPLLIMVAVSAPVAVLWKNRSRKELPVFPDPVQRITYRHQGMEKQQDYTIILEWKEDRLFLQARGYDETGEAVTIENREVPVETGEQLLCLLKAQNVLETNAHNQTGLDHATASLTVTGSDESVTVVLDQQLNETLQKFFKELKLS